MNWRSQEGAEVVLQGCGLLPGVASDTIRV